MDRRDAGDRIAAENVRADCLDLQFGVRGGGGMVLRAGDFYLHFAHISGGGRRICHDRVVEPALILQPVGIDRARRT